MLPTYLHSEPWQWEWTVHWVLHIYFSVVGDELKKSTLNSEKKDKKIKIVSWNVLGTEERVRESNLYETSQNFKKNLIPRLVIDEIKKKKKKV